MLLGFINKYRNMTSNITPFGLFFQLMYLYLQNSHAHPCVYTHTCTHHHSKCYFPGVAMGKQALKWGPNCHIYLIHVCSVGVFFSEQILLLFVRFTCTKAKAQRDFESFTAEGNRGPALDQCILPHPSLDSILFCCPVGSLHCLARLSCLGLLKKAQRHRARQACIQSLIHNLLGF